MRPRPGSQSPVPQCGVHGRSVSKRAKTLVESIANKLLPGVLIQALGVSFREAHEALSLLCGQHPCRAVGPKQVPVFIPISLVPASIGNPLCPGNLGRVFQSNVPPGMVIVRLWPGECRQTGPLQGPRRGPLPGISRRPIGDLDPRACQSGPLGSLGAQSPGAPPEPRALRPTTKFGIQERRRLAAERSGHGLRICRRDPADIFHHHLQGLVWL